MVITVAARAPSKKLVITVIPSYYNCDGVHSLLTNDGDKWKELFDTAFEYARQRVSKRRSLPQRQ